MIVPKARHCARQNQAPGNIDHDAEKPNSQDPSPTAMPAQLRSAPLFRCHPDAATTQQVQHSPS
jgi:hypothetical protein